MHEIVNRLWKNKKNNKLHTFLFLNNYTNKNCEKLFSRLKIL